MKKQKLTRRLFIIGMFFLITSFISIFYGPLKDYFIVLIGIAWLFLGVVIFINEKQ